MEDTKLGFQFEPVFAKPTCPSYNDKPQMNHRSEPPEVFCKERCSQKFHKIHRKAPVPESLFKKMLLKKKRLAQAFSCEFCGISKSTFFTEHLFFIWATASGTRNPAYQIEFSRMAQLSKLQKDANQIRMHVLPRNSRSSGI